VTDVNETFQTDDVTLAAVCMASGATLIPPKPDEITGRLSFRFRDLPPDFESRILSGDLTVRAKDVISSTRVILNLVSNHRRTQKVSGGVR